MLMMAVPFSSVVPLPIMLPSTSVMLTVPFTIGSPVTVSVTVMFTVVLPRVAFTTL